MKRMKILATGMCTGSNTLSNEDMTRFVESSDEWIRSRTGIAKRHFCDPEKGESNEWMAENAGRMALESAGVPMDKIGAIIVCTATPDFATPSTACLVQKGLGVGEDCACFDINAACTGFIYGLRTCYGLLEEDKPYGLVIGVEQMSRVLDMTDRSTCVLFGDGAGAAVVERLFDNGDSCPYETVLRSRGDSEALYIEGLGHADNYIHMKGSDVFRFATRVMEENIFNLLDKTGLTLSDFDLVICHQANRRIIEHVIRRMQKSGQDAPDEKFYMNMDRYGNTSAASIPIALHELSKAGKIKPGSRLLLDGFGGGFTWASAMITF